MTLNKLIYSTLFFLLLNFLQFCDRQAQEPIRIGATMSLSGAYSIQGIPAHNGYLLCADEINARGGLLNRPVEFVIYDDQSDSQTAIDLYEKLITEDKVDAVMGPYGSTLTEAVAPVTEKYRMVHISPLAATTSIWEKDREYLFMVLPPAELFLAGLIDMAHSNGLTNVAVIYENALFPAAAAAGAKQRVLDLEMNLVLHEAYPSGTVDFTPVLNRIKENDTQVLAMAASSLSDFISVVQQMKENEISVAMFGTSGAVNEFQQVLGEDAEYVYGLSAWEPGLITPGIESFVTGYQNRFGIEPSFHAAGAYGSCQLFEEAVKLANSLDSDEIRDQLLKLEITTVFGDFKVDERGYQIANKGLFIQWQDGKKVIVWPDDIAESEARFPTPLWNQRP